MPQSLSRVILHLIFSTKNRHPFLDQDIRPKMHAYLATVCRSMDVQAYRVGGVADHIHIACDLPRTITISNVVEKIKKESSKWIKTQGANSKYSKFFWQSGFGAFSVAPSQLDKLIAYIDGQEEHHRTVTFQDEFRQFLRKYRIEYDEQYVWD